MDKADRSSHSSTEGKNAWNYTSTPYTSLRHDVENFLFMFFKASFSYVI